MNYCKKNDTQRNTFFSLFFSAVSTLFFFSPSFLHCKFMKDFNALICQISKIVKSFMREGILFETLLSSLFYVKFIDLFIFQT